MGIARIAKVLSLALSLGAALGPSPTAADDTDLFVGTSGGSTAAPNVVILLDNMNNWVSDQPNGKSKLMALKAVMDSIKSPLNVGLAMFASNSPSGAYIRFALRDMSVATNRAAFQNLMDQIALDSHVNIETGVNKEEPAALYEIYKYFAGLTPRTGTLAQNPNADANGNTGSYAGATAFGQGLTSDFAFKADGTYNAKPTACGKAYIIYLVANNGDPQVTGQQAYEGVSAGPALLPAVRSPDEWSDEWAHYLYTGTTPQITTYVLDAYYPDDNQSLPYSNTLQAIAKQGGGTYTHVRDQTEITNALLTIFGQIQAVNSTFASATLPVSATARTQSKNQVFTGQFRPTPDATPRWFGNMKRYQLILNGSGVDLGDKDGAAAINTTTGFLNDCAASFWTTDSGTYWQNVPISPAPKGQCPTTSFSPYSDSPDGPEVEKGAVAELLRKTYPIGITNTQFTRVVKSLSAGALVDFNTANFTVANSGLDANTVNFIRGQDVNDENNNKDIIEARPSIHGDVIHSRPLALDQGSTFGVTVYYGANDGTFRAVDASSGAERWSFVAPEFFPKLQRLKDNSPLVNYPNIPTTVTPTPVRKGFFFDGSTGVYQNKDNTKVWIYPSMRRGGRMIYAFDVTNPTSPKYKWKFGCPNPADNVGCTPASATAIGQTWSTPTVAFIHGYSTTTPVVIVGGGYDGCEDADSKTPSCTSPQGAAVYVLDADTGTLLQTITLSGMRSVVADVSLVDIDFDGFVDYAYVADTGGNIYRIDFIDGPVTKSDVSNGSWQIHQVAKTAGAGRKFLFAPALLQNSNKVYVAIASGDREHPLQASYPYTAPVTNRFYVYLDDLKSTSTVTDLDDTTVMADYTTEASPCCNAPILPGSTKKGWFMNLQAGTGEQGVTSAVIAGGLVAFSTNRPIPSPAGTCTTTLGEARGYFVNLFNGSGVIGVSGAQGGTRSAIFAGGGLPPSPVLATVLIGTVTKTVVIGAAQKSGAASSSIAPQLVSPPIVPRRKPRYWYQSGDN